ncbi:MAG: hypothetical protein KME26_30560 [Oscillatoria princeps RMCB-10]|nr:hypothetical protein [Oscillatoria princeps RMCB-10]
MRDSFPSPAHLSSPQSGVPGAWLANRSHKSAAFAVSTGSFLPHCESQWLLAETAPT